MGGHHPDSQRWGYFRVIEKLFFFFTLDFCGFFRGEEKRTVADFVINAAGLWCDKVGAMAGVRVPSVVLQHQ